MSKLGTDQIMKPNKRPDTKYFISLSQNIDGYMRNDKCKYKDRLTLTHKSKKKIMARNYARIWCYGV